MRHAQSRVLARVAFALADGELRALGVLFAELLTLAERADLGVFLVGQVVPLLARAGQGREDELLEDVAVEEDALAGELGAENRAGLGGLFGLYQGQWDPRRLGLQRNVRRASVGFQRPRDL